MTREQFERKADALALKIRRLDDLEYRGVYVSVVRRAVVEELLKAYRDRVATIHRQQESAA